MIKSINISSSTNDGILEITAVGWDGRILAMSRNAFLIWQSQNIQVPETAAVYLVYADHFDKPNLGKKLYVGHAGKILNRLNQHVAAKDHWCRVLIFISKNDWMNIAFTQNIEYQFIAWAKSANRYLVENGTDSAITHLGREDRQLLDSYLAEVRPILTLAGIDVFKLNLDGIYEYRFEPGAGKLACISRVRIEQVGPKKSVRFLMGSQVWSYSMKEIDISSFPEMILADDRVTFKEEFVVSVDEKIIPRIFGCSIDRWISPNGIGLKEAFANPVHITSVP